MSPLCLREDRMSICFRRSKDPYRGDQHIEWPLLLVWPLAHSPHEPTAVPSTPAWLTRAGASPKDAVRAMATPDMPTEPCGRWGRGCQGCAVTLDQVGGGPGIFLLCHNHVEFVDTWRMYP